MIKTISLFKNENQPIILNPSILFTPNDKTIISYRTSFHSNHKYVHNANNKQEQCNLISTKWPIIGLTKVILLNCNKNELFADGFIFPNDFKSIELFGIDGRLFSDKLNPNFFYVYTNCYIGESFGNVLHKIEIDENNRMRIIWCNLIKINDDPKIKNLCFFIKDGDIHCCDFMTCNMYYFKEWTKKVSNIGMSDVLNIKLNRLEMENTKITSDLYDISPEISILVNSKIDNNLNKSLQKLADNLYESLQNLFDDFYELTMSYMINIKYRSNDKYNSINDIAQQLLSNNLDDIHKNYVSKIWKYIQLRHEWNSNNKQKEDILNDNILKPHQNVKITNVTNPNKINWFGSSCLSNNMAIVHTKLTPNMKKVYSYITEPNNYYKNDYANNVCNSFDPNLDCNWFLPKFGFDTRIDKKKSNIIDIVNLFKYELNIDDKKNILILLSQLCYILLCDYSIESHLMIIMAVAFERHHVTFPIYYINSIVKISDDLSQINEISNPFIFINCTVSGVNYICGFDNEHDDYVISYSTDDSNSYVTRINKSKFSFTKEYDWTKIMFIDNDKFYDIVDFCKTFITNKYKIDKLNVNELFVSLIKNILDNSVSYVDKNKAIIIDAISIIVNMINKEYHRTHFYSLAKYIKYEKKIDNNISLTNSNNSNNLL